MMADGRFTVQSPRTGNKPTNHCEDIQHFLIVLYMKSFYSVVSFPMFLSCY